jgi:hypothetical protein
MYHRWHHFQRLLSHVIRSNNRKSSQARIQRETDSSFGNSNLHRFVNQYFKHCVHIRQAEAPCGSCLGRLFYFNYRIHHPPQPRACLGQRTIRSSVSCQCRCICRPASSLDSAFEQRLWNLQDCMGHWHGNWSRQRWWICCIALIPAECCPILLARLQNHVFADVYGGILDLCLCGWTLVREQAKTRRKGIIYSVRRATTWEMPIPNFFTPIRIDEDNSSILSLAS